MFDSIVQTIAELPYVGIAFLFVLCGLGLPVPEELVLLGGGYICATYPDKAALPWMMVWCAGAIMAGDMLPYLMGRIFGPRLLRVRWLRVFATRRRLSSFDRWFRRRGDLVIFIARFLPGIRSVAFFTAGTMKMSLPRFMVLDGCGVVVIVPALTMLGYHSAAFVDVVVARMKQVERGILWSTIGVGVLAALWFWLWRHRHRLRAARVPAETYVEPQLPVEGPPLPGWMHEDGAVSESPRPPSRPEREPERPERPEREPAPPLPPQPEPKPRPHEPQPFRPQPELPTDPDAPPEWEPPPDEPGPPRPPAPGEEPAP